MARSIKKSRNTAKRKWSRRHVWVALIVLSLVLISVIGWNTYQSSQHQMQLKASLDRKGQELDKVVNSLKDSGIAGRAERSKFCYEASRKFAKGPTYCMQKVEITAEGIDNSQILVDFAIIAEAMNEHTSLDLTNHSALDEFDEDNRVYADFFQKQRSKYANCNANFYGRNNLWHNEAARGSYDIRVDCLGADFSRSIYEFRD